MENKANIDALEVRPATAQDIPALLEYIGQLAAHEGRPEAAIASEEDLQEWLFEKQAAHALLAYYEGEPAGYAIYYPVFSSFAGACSGYLEDILILPNLRGKGLGRALMNLVAEEARTQGYSTLQWSCLNSNTDALAFYEKLGAKQKPQATTFYWPLG